MKKILKRTFFIALGLFAIIFVVRVYNDYKYKDSNNVETPEYYKDVRNISLYPTDIEGVDVRYVDEGSLQGFQFTPKKKLYNGVVLCFGGSEGSPNFETAQKLSQKGFETFAIFMFGMKNQQDTLVRIPLEQFEDILAYLHKTIDDQVPISIIAASKGAEYVLNLASKYPEISNLVLIAPSSYNFAGLDFNDYGSSWTYKGEELPYIDIKKGSFGSFLKNIVLSSIVNAPISYKDTYTSAVESDSNREEKMIPIKDVKANILMIAGVEDAMWDSLNMANIIKNQSPHAKLLSYEGAGHIFGANGILNLENMRIKTGGNLKANQKAQVESEEAIENFLKDQHK
ncbi:acyl-CoA thioester hydrolase/BAAT C-terminal domain-containing protein [Anaerococcus sp. DFU013_CI05]|uniref:acyl-CoA thioester hydrolase/BAAT C-terminal domain-containing protein n=1 Tax=Anaerococcus sp. AH8042_DFU013_CI05 TaxID=3385202 RepID=UPI003A521FED